ncbi:MAG: YciI family protein [Bryobacterales bacterium]|nr:YciI family protein [Bryobacterales bacterium]MBV9397404.1 YciI family protein [Bryobacterales bacterium]
MRYMMLVYSTEGPDGLPPAEAERIRAGHAKVMEEAGRKRVLVGAEPLAPTSTATTVRVQNGMAQVTDGPFAETKEHLAGYYIMECENLDEAIEWAAKIPTECQGRQGCIEIRPMRWQPSHKHAEADLDKSISVNG